MRKANRIITLGLTAIAVLFWLSGVTGYDFCHGFLTYRRGSSWYMNNALAFAGLAAVGWVLVTWQAARGDGETRCRKCKYILKGLSEPRCPECGEPI